MRYGNLIKLHFGLLLFLVLHFFLQGAYGFGLNTTIRFALKLLLYGSGILLFFGLLKQKSWIKYYASLYVISPLIVVIGYLLDGILGAILGSVFFLFLNVPTSVISDKNYTVKTEYAGFMNSCCSYALFENKFGIFERKVTRFKAQVSEREMQRLRINPARTRALIYYTNQQNQTKIVEILLPAR